MSNSRSQRTEHRNQTTAENAYKARNGNRIKAEEKTLSEEGVFFYVSKEKTFTGYVLLRENTVCGIIMEV